jgi:hypothetical protein
VRRSSLHANFWRLWLPVALCVLGTVVLIVDGANVFGVDAFAAFCGAGLSIALTNVLWRLGIAGNRDRDDEEDARRYLAQHGQWPEDHRRGPRPGAPPGPVPPPAPAPAPASPPAPVNPDRPSADTDGAAARRAWESQHRRR